MSSYLHRLAVGARLLVLNFVAGLGLNSSLWWSVHFKLLELQKKKKMLLLFFNSKNIKRLRRCTDIEGHKGCIGVCIHMYVCEKICKFEGMSGRLHIKN